MAHPHYKLIQQFAKDAEKYDDPGQFWRIKTPGNKDWRRIPGNTPEWWPDCEYMRVPETITIGGIEVPKPVGEPLEDDQVYYIPSPEEYDFHRKMRWNGLGDACDINALKRHRIHLTKEAAQVHAKAEILLAGGTIEEEDK